MSKLIVVGPASPLRGGIADFNEALAKELIKNGSQVELISFSLQYPSFLFPGKSQYKTNRSENNELKISSIINSINPFSWIKTANYIIAQQPSAVIFRFWIPFMGLSLGFIARRIKKKGIPVYAITDNVIPHEKRIGDHLLTNYFIKSCDGFITMSKAVYEDISFFNPQAKKVCLFHPVYNVFGDKSSKSNSLKALDLPNVNYLLFFGLIREYKGLELAIKAMQDSKIKALGIKLIIAGEFYADKEKYTGLINKLKLDNIIIHDEFIPSDKVKYYFGIADAVVQPYKSATQSGITQVAYHFETPMIVTNVGGLPEIVQDGKQGYVCEVNSSAIASAILNLYEKEGKIEQIKEQVSIRKSSFSWEEFVKGLNSFINS